MESCFNSPNLVVFEKSPNKGLGLTPFYTVERYFIGKENEFWAWWHWKALEWRAKWVEVIIKLACEHKHIAS